MAAGLAKTAVNRLAFAQGHELAPFGATALAITPGWLRSEMMLDAFAVTEDTWRDALVPADGRPTAPAGFAQSESPRYVGRAVAALAIDPGRARWNQCSVTTGRLAAEYGFTDLDGSRPDGWRQLDEAAGRGPPGRPDGPVAIGGDEPLMHLRAPAARRDRHHKMRIKTVWSG